MVRMIIDVTQNNNSAFQLIMRVYQISTLDMFSSVVLVGAAVVLVGAAVELVGAAVVLVGAAVVLVGAAVVLVGAAVVLVGAAVVLVGAAVGFEATDSSNVILPGAYTDPTQVTM